MSGLRQPQTAICRHALARHRRLARMSERTDTAQGSTSAWATTSSHVAYENPWIRVREDEVVRPDGADGIYGVVELRNPAVFVIALDDDDRVLMVDIDRYTVGRSLEVVSGGTDGQDALTAARRELLEETGFEADDWTQIGTMNALNGVCVAPETVFIARGLRAHPGSGAGEGTADTVDTAAEQASEGISQVKRVPFDEALAMVSTVITDGETIAALGMAAVHLGRVRGRVQ